MFAGFYIYRKNIADILNITYYYFGSIAVQIHPIPVYGWDDP